MKKVIIPEINTDKCVSLESVSSSKGNDYLMFGSINKEPKGFILYNADNWYWCDQSNFEDSNEPFPTEEPILLDLINNILSVYPNMEFNVI